jgi:hypothetical protein
MEVKCCSRVVQSRGTASKESVNEDAKKSRLDSRKRSSAKHSLAVADLMLQWRDTSFDSDVTSTSVHKENRIWPEMEYAYKPSSGYLVRIYVLAVKLLQLFII